MNGIDVNEAQDLTHFSDSGRARMVDVADKSTTHRLAVASGVLRLQPATLERIRAGRIAKGDVLAVADVAAVMAAKRTADLIPMCHTLALAGVDVDFCEILTPDAQGCVGIKVTTAARCVGQTGVEMEALCAASAALLTIYDMCKSIDRGMRIENVQLDDKRGGKSGVWRRDAPPVADRCPPRSAGAGVDEDALARDPADAASLSAVTPPVLIFVGHSGSGKTTLIEKLLPELTGRGLRLATIKHAHHKVALDHQGKDSWRYTQAGAALSMLVTADELQLVADAVDRRDPAQLAQRFLGEADLILAEGFSHAPGVKIEILRRECDRPPRCAIADGLIAIVTDIDEVYPELPHFALDDIAGLADFVLAYRSR